MNPFEAYAGKAKMLVTQPPKLIGAIKTRAEARVVYDEMVARIRAFRRRDELTAYLEDISSRILQFHAELPFLWEGDGADFLGLEREIEAAFETIEAAEYFSKGAAFETVEAAQYFATVSYGSGPCPDARPGAYPVN